MRKAFSMLMAVSVMVTMMALSALVFTMSAKIVKSTATQYQKEQSILLAKSYTELAILAVSGNDNTTGTCVENINGDVGNVIIGNTNEGDVNSGMGYRVSVNIFYIGNDLSCNNSRILNTAPIITKGTGDINISPNIIVDVYVRYRDINEHLTTGISHWITYHKRTIQKL
jgi:hypothetical protein